MVTEDRLRTLLRVAESAHAAFIVARLREEPESGATHELHLDDEELRLREAAVHAHLNDFGHDEADILRRLKTLHAKVKTA